MPTYNPDGSIDLDSTNRIGVGGAGGTAGSYADHWFRDNYSTLDGLQADRGYDHYEPAFRYGWESAGTRAGRGWTEAETELERDWRGRHTDRDWNEHKGAVRHAFERAMHVFEGGPDPDKRK